MHHVTAITAQASRNLEFYTRLLGMRLVKKTVNQDDLKAYHLFYGDGLGTPGSDITFFDWPAEREKRGSGSIIRTGLRVSGEEALCWWIARLSKLSIPNSGLLERAGRKLVEFEDPEGQRLMLIDDREQASGAFWKESEVPKEFQIRGLGPAIMSVIDFAATDQVLREVLKFRRTIGYELNGSQVFVYEIGSGGCHAELHVAHEPKLAPARQGAGAVHHLAFCAADQDYYKWAAWLKEARIPNSGKVDRFYFRSLYFREPGGVLFEIATQGPGFTADEPLNSLGERLSLPPFLEHRRGEIEANLKPL